MDKVQKRTKSEAYTQYINLGSGTRTYSEDASDVAVTF
jgi:hypothetical protein